MARNSKVIIAKNIKLDRNYTNVLNYTEQQMLDLVNTNKVAESLNCSFIRQTGTISTPFSYSQCLQSNYIAFQNPDYDNKWFFGWIDDVVYKSNGTGEIKFTIDIFSTWFNKLTLNPVNVIREHVNDDTIGLHTINENLSVGEVVQEDFERLLPLKNTGENIPYDSLYNFVFVIETTHEPLLDTDYNGICIRNSNLTGCYTFYFEINTNTYNNILHFLNAMNLQSKINSILNIYIAHKNIVSNMNKIKRGDYSVNGYEYYELLNTDESINVPATIQKKTSFSGLTIKNNKCFVYPYNYILISNNVGNQLLLKYEDFKQANPIVEIEMALSIGCSIRLVPREYKNIDRNIDESIPLGKFPTCAWASDSFINWITGNGVNIGTAIYNAVKSFSTGDVVTGAEKVGAILGAFIGADLLPSISGGNNSGDVNFSAMENCFDVHYMRAKDEYIKIIDDYFTKFGYLVNSLKVPNVTGRTYWNYVSINKGDIVGFGEIPSTALDQINEIFYKGVTIWHNHANIGNYSLNNTIVS